jgi:hypothetical protein
VCAHKSVIGQAARRQAETFRQAPKLAEGIKAPPGFHHGALARKAACLKHMGAAAGTKKYVAETADPS